MGERKVLNFYISPDFDASIMPRVKRDWDKLIEVRSMLAFSIRCNTCGEYMYRGKKFNMKKEMVKGDDYLGIRKFRFYIKCSFCSADISFKTDPKNSDYEMETGASRNFEVWRDSNEAIEAAKLEREDEDKQDAMKSLENRTIDSKIEMDVLDALDEMKAINQRHEHVDTDELLDTLTFQKPSSEVLSSGLTAEDEKLIKSIKFKSSTKLSTLSDSDEDVSHHSKFTGKSLSLMDNVAQQLAKAGAVKSNQDLAMPTIIKRKRKVPDSGLVDKNDTAIPTLSSSSSSASNSKLPKTAPVSTTSSSAQPPAPTCPGLPGLLMGYGDSDEDST